MKYDDAYREMKRDAQRARNRKYYYNHREKIKEKQARWRRSNPNYFREYHERQKKERMQDLE